MTKKKEICQYKLLLLRDKEDKKTVSSIENLLGKESIQKIKELEQMPAYKIDRLSNPSYLLVYFSTTRQIILSLEKNIRQLIVSNSLSRYNLVNLTDQKNSKIKKNVK